MWFLYVNKMLIAKSPNILRLCDIVRVLMDCSEVILIELKPELEF